jgi:hypothetical protein
MHTHIKKYPSLYPFIGKHYQSDKHKRVLIIGESHYQPEGSINHLNPKVWYAQSETNLSEKEIGWISTDRIVREAKHEGFKNHAFVIFREIARQLNDAGLKYQNFHEAIEHCMFYNYFQRPAEETGNSINIRNEDEVVAESVLRWVISSFSPELVIVVSRLAGKYACSILKKQNIHFINPPHPASQWWNRKSAKYDGLYGRELIVQFLNEKSWLHE